MIDADILVRYTDALYKTLPEQAPRYDEFRDMFSSGQIYSKKWLVDELTRLGVNAEKPITICGSWFGLLAFFLNKNFPSADITCVDIDPRGEIFFNHLRRSNERHLRAVTADMYLYNYTQGLVINTSCEHISEIGSWLSLLAPGSPVALQSSNYRLSDQHIACVDSAEELAAKCQPYLSETLFCGELKFPMYSRYMVIGTKG